MQWIVDIIKGVFDTGLAGTIIAWSGAIVDIPDGWQLCDGTNGTPDLKARFIIGSGSSYSPDDTGGSLAHTHTGESDAHLHGEHFIVPGLLKAAGGKQFNYARENFTSDPDGIEPPYYTLAFIKKITIPNIAYQMIGNPVPDITGDYKAANFNDGEPSYQHKAINFRISYNSIAVGWSIWGDLNGGPGYGWLKFGSIYGDYLAIPPAAGTPTVVPV